MDVIGAFWHLLNFAAPAVAIGLLASLMARLLWRHEMAGISVWRLWRWSSGLALIASIAGLIVFGRDGKMATYTAIVLSGAAGLWWAGFLRRK